MKNIKKIIKNCLPDKVMYIYSILKILPRFLKISLLDRNKKYSVIKFYSDTDTVDKIINERKSLSRYGDGEFIWMSGMPLDSFQEYSDEFSNDLKKSFQSNNPNLLIGIPYGIFDSHNCNFFAKMHWKCIKSRFLDNLLKFVDLDKTYCNASITRPYIDYRDREYSKKCFDNLQRIWANRDIVFVEGEKTKLGLGNDLFNNAKSIRRIICPTQNAYSSIDDIKQSIVKNVSKNDLLLTALGPTASILATQMCDIGYQIVDIGHVDIEYWWYNHKSILRDEVPGKYVNESGRKDCSNDYDNNKIYLNSIIDKLL